MCKCPFKWRTLQTKGWLAPEQLTLLGAQPLNSGLFKDRKECPKITTGQKRNRTAQEEGLSRHEFQKSQHICGVASYGKKKALEIKAKRKTLDF